MSASVKVMLSYDYCHFEFARGTDQELTDAELDEVRKGLMRLADKAIVQYQQRKVAAQTLLARQGEYEALSRQVRRIEEKAEGDRTINELAQLKAFTDHNWARELRDRYDYQDDWDDRDDQ